MDGLKTSSQVAEMFGMKRTRLNTILARHNHLRPANKIVLGGFGAYQWTDTEVEALRQYLQSIKRDDTQEGKDKNAQD